MQYENWIWAGFLTIEKKSINAIYHINKLKEEKQIIISGDAESEFNKIK